MCIRDRIDIASKHILPAVMRYARNLAGTANELKSAGAVCAVPVKVLEKMTGYLNEAYEALDELKNVTIEAAEMENGEEQARFYHDKVTVAMERLRKPVDELEMIVDKEEWPMPSYGDLLFEV